jgi:hypothetical protein
VIIIFKVWMHLKVFLKPKNPKNSLQSKKTQKTPKTKKNQKNQKNHWAGFFYKKPGLFPTLDTGAEAGEAGGPGGRGEVGGRGAEDARGQYCQSDASQLATSGTGYHGARFCRGNTAFNIVPVPYMKRLIGLKTKLVRYLLTGILYTVGTGTP